jgi:hypothetical protein
MSGIEQVKRITLTQGFLILTSPIDRPVYVKGSAILYIHAKDNHSVLGMASGISQPVKEDAASILEAISQSYLQAARR